MKFSPDPKPERRVKKVRVPLKRTRIKQKLREPTGELKLFLHIYAKVRGKSQLTGEALKFSVGNFVHVLSKGSAGNMRLDEENIVHAEFDFHHMYDNCSKEVTLKKYPQAAWIYELKEKMKEKHERKSKNNEQRI
jgi:hypothetical protein